VVPFGEMALSDTTPAVRAVQEAVQQAMSGEQRLLLAFEMSLFARALATECIRQDHPDWSETRIERELLRLAVLPNPFPPALT
jgi:hypothetical protein